MSKEIVIPEDEFIVSRTDKLGNITYASESFCKISGFDKKELVGMPHSMVRHEDMPKTAFKDMWETIRQGKTWKGYVKNRTKYGDFYWVYAEVSPHVKDGKFVGYKSIRQKPDRKILEEKIEQYQKLKENENSENGKISIEVSEVQKKRFVEICEKLGHTQEDFFEELLNLSQKLLKKTS